MSISLIFKIFLVFFFSLVSITRVFWAMSFESKMNVFENYLKNQKTNIEKICTTYEICGATKIKNILEETDMLVENIGKIKNITLKDYEEKVTIEVISDKIEKLSQDTKKYIKKEIENYEEEVRKQKLYYDKVARKIENSLEKIISTIYSRNIENNSQHNQKLINVLVELKETTTKLENFRKMDFKNNTAMKHNFLHILLEIKREVLELQKSV